jgi:hypothetical protein
MSPLSVVKSADQSTESTVKQITEPFIRYVRKGDKTRSIAFKKAEKAENKEEALKKVFETKFDRTPIGVFVAKPIEDKVVFGVSLCCDKDDYSKKRGREIALARVEKNFKHWEQSGVGYIEIPNSVHEEFHRFYKRCEKYFKDKKFPNVRVQPSAPKNPSPEVDG